MVRDPLTEIEHERGRTLGWVLQRARGKRTLIKIDVEGGEASVLRGASTLLRQSRPTIIFESNDRGARAELAALLGEHGYAITRLPWPDNQTPALSASDFGSSIETNFLARPREAGSA